MSSDRRGAKAAPTEISTRGTQGGGLVLKEWGGWGVTNTKGALRASRATNGAPEGTQGATKAAPEGHQPPRATKGHPKATNGAPHGHPSSTPGAAHIRGVDAEGVRREPLGADAALQFDLSQLPPVLLIHRPRLRVHGLGAVRGGLLRAAQRRLSPSEPSSPPRYVPHVPSDPSRSRFRSPQQQRRRPPARPPPCKATNDASARLTPEPRPPSPALGPRPTRSRRRRRSVRAGRAVQRPGAPGPPLRSPPREPPLPLPPLPPPPLLLTLPRELAPSAALARFPASKGNAHGGTHVPMAAAPPTGGRREEREVTSPL